MADPVRIPLSIFQQKRLAQLDTDARFVAQLKSEAVTAIVSATHDPATIGTWSITLQSDAIVLTPPADEAQGPQLVKDIDANGVSASAEVAAG